MAEYPETYSEAVAAIRRCRRDRRYVAVSSIPLLLYAVFRFAVVLILFTLLFLAVSRLSPKGGSLADFLPCYYVTLGIMVIALIGTCFSIRRTTVRILDGSFFNGKTEEEVLKLAREYVASYGSYEAKREQRTAKRKGGGESHDP